MFIQIVLFGDSITEMFDVKLLDGCSKLEIYNRGIGGDTTNRLIERLGKNVLCLKPSQLVLLIGTNDFGRGADCEYVFKNIKKIINIIKNDIPGIKIKLRAYDGSLDTQFSDDGVHPNAKGFNIVAEALKEVIE